MQQQHFPGGCKKHDLKLQEELGTPNLFPKVLPAKKIGWDSVDRGSASSQMICKPFTLHIAKFNGSTHWQKWDQTVADLCGSGFV